MIFNGYSDGPSTIDMIHKRRGLPKQSPTVQFEEEMMFTGKKDIFMENNKNKERFLKMVGEELKLTGCRGDADVDIAQTAIYESINCNVTLVGEDTDLLVLLLYFAKNSKYICHWKRNMQRL